MKLTTKTTPRATAALFAALAFAASAPLASAETANYSSSTSTLWTTKTNWDTNAVPSTTADVIFDTNDGTAFSATNTTTGQIKLGGSNVATAATVTFKKSSTWTTGWTFAATGTSNSLTLAGSGTVTVDAGTSATIDPFIAGSVGLTKAGAGSLTLGGTKGGASTYSGTTNVSAGALILGTANAVSANSSTFAVDNGATLTNSSGATLNKTFNLTEGATLNGTSGFTSTLTTVTADLSNVFSAITLGSSLASSTLNFSLSGITEGTYSIFTGAGSVASSFTTVQVGGSDITLGDIGGFNYTFLGNTLSVSASAIPEPSTYAALAGLGILGFAATRRRRSAA